MWLLKHLFLEVFDMQLMFIVLNKIECLEEILEKLQKAGYTKKENKRWSLTPNGYLLSNRIILLLQEAQREAARVGGEE